MIETQDYTTEKLLAGMMITNHLALAAGTYYRGQNLVWNGTNNNYEDAAGATPDAIYIGEEVTFALATKSTLMIWGEVQLEGLVNGSNVAIGTLTDAEIKAYQDNGIFVK